MNTFENQQEVAVSLVTVNQYLANPVNLSAWNPAVSRVVKIKENDYLLTRKYGQVREEENLNVLEHTKNRVVFKLSGGRVDYQLRFELTAMALGRTSISETIDFNYKQRGMFATLLLGAQPLLRKAITDNFKRLVRQLERIEKAERVVTAERVIDE